MVHSRLLDVAVREFATKGLDGASTRGIAAAAGTAMSSITYHYGGKEGLYLAAADYVAAQIRDDRMRAVVEAARGAATPEDARASIHAILGRFVEKLSQPENPEWALFMMREQAQPTAAFDRLYDGAMCDIVEPLIELVCTASGLRDSAASRIVVITMIGQVVVLRAGGAVCRRVLQVSDYPADLLQKYKARVAANCDAILDSLIAERREQS